MKQHDDPSDEVRPLADLTTYLPPPDPIPDIPLPLAARADELTTPPVRGPVYSSAYKKEWVRLKIQNNCFAGEDPVMHVTHAPHILQPLEYEEEGSVSLPPSTASAVESMLGTYHKDRLLDRVLGRKKRKRGLVVVVEIPLRKRSKLAEEM